MMKLQLQSTISVKLTRYLRQRKAIWGIFWMNSLAKTHPLTAFRKFR